ncbi:hypothetical protein BCR41DRAFT_231086 [Lobosporangium transversale]|uniref:Uncharacterized protein n=1 Tax=Lobosporangium transversale TaxID=64571 RepID=A0A1Y2G5Y5_9FUNG|nr:hypothetical protein BCR41DRAFT_231086 [Lobosporangium transversale]ORY96991.1 hypothetical protein BCR41DRAFT_231086 [Lobosporangium transversale]|eukprot:XP_021875553.1 hypothetical protein BCR41DRAFT_231086 [Lobosporangium transversale]
MSHRAEESRNNQDMTQCQNVPRVMPCPTHTVGHTTILITQLSSMTPPYELTRHQNQQSHIETTQWMLGNTKSCLVQPAVHKNMDNEAFERTLWHFIPPTFHLEHNGTSPEPVLEDEQLRSKNLNSNSQLKSPISSSDNLELDIRYGSSKTELLSPESPSNKRRHHNILASSCPKKRKDQAIHQQQATLSPLPQTFMSTSGQQEKNPFEVHEPNYSIDAGENSRLGLLSELQDIRRSRHELFYQSQQALRPSWKTAPTTPPTMRYRGWSLDRDNPSAHSLAPFYGPPLTTSNIRALDVINENTQSYNSKAVHPSPSDRLTELPFKSNSASCSRDSEATHLMSTGSHTDGDPAEDRNFPSLININDNPLPDDSTIIFKTPTKTRVRRLSMSSLSTKSPSSISSVTPQTLFQTHSINEHDLPLWTPADLVQDKTIQNLHNGSSIGMDPNDPFVDSPTSRIQWSQSLETPEKKRLESDATKETQNNAIIQKLRGLQPIDFMDDMAQGLEGWSESLETPPRKCHVKKALELAPNISSGILDRLRGIPHISPPAKATVQSALLQSESFNSTSSSPVDGSGAYQEDESSINRSIDSYAVIDQGITEEGLVKQRVTTTSADTDPTFAFQSELKMKEDISETSSDTAETNTEITLPSSLVHELESDSPLIEDNGYQSQILSDSQIEFFDGISNSAIDKELLGSSNKSRERFPQPDKSQEAGLNNYQSPDNSAITIQDSSEPPTLAVMAATTLKGADEEQEENVRESDGISISQELNLDNMHLDSWVLSSSTQSNQDISVNMKQDNEINFSEHRNEMITDMTSDDDFSNIRFSQLDDGFNAACEITQIPYNKSVHTKTNAGNLEINDDATGLSILSTKKQSEPCRATTRRNGCEQPLFTNGGFASASGRKLVPVSKAALARAALMLDDSTSDTGLNAEVRPIHSPLDIFSTTADPSSFDRAGTSGASTLQNTENTLPNMVVSLLPDEETTGAKIAANPLITKSIKNSEHQAMKNPSSITNAHQQFKGFTSGSGKKLSAISKEAMEKWSKQFEEEDMSEPLRPLQPSQPHSASLSKALKEYAGFSSGSGKALPPISNAARNRALDVLEVDENDPVPPAVRRTPLSTELGIARPVPISLPGPQPMNSISSNPKIVASSQQPVISSHMNKLKLKSLRASSSSLSLPGLLKAKAPFRPPLPFKSPIRRTDTVVNPCTGDNSNILHAPLPESATLNKKQTGRKSILHPNAHSTCSTSSTTNPTYSSKDIRVPSYTSLFNLEAHEKRLSLREVLDLPRHRDVGELMEIGV